MEQIKIREYNKKFSGVFYNINDESIKEPFKNLEEHLDFRYQIACLKAEGYYCIFDYDEDKTICQIEPNGGIKNFVDPEFRLIDLTCAIRNIQIGDNTEKIIPKKFY